MEKIKESTTNKNIIEARIVTDKQFIRSLF